MSGRIEKEWPDENEALVQRRARAMKRLKGIPNNRWRSLVDDVLQSGRLAVLKASPTVADDELEREIDRKMDAALRRPKLSVPVCPLLDEDTADPGAPVLLGLRELELDLEEMLADRPDDKRIVELRMSGYTNKQIAQEIGIPVRRVSKSLDRLYRELLAEYGLEYKRPTGRNSGKVPPNTAA